VTNCCNLELVDLELFQKAGKCYSGLLITPQFHDGDAILRNDDRMAL
jgi:hypothetical protein